MIGCLPCTLRLLSQASWASFLFSGHLPLVPGQGISISGPLATFSVPAKPGQTCPCHFRSAGQQCWHGASLGEAGSSVRETELTFKDTRFISSLSPPERSHWASWSSPPAPSWPVLSAPP